VHAAADAESHDGSHAEPHSSAIAIADSYTDTKPNGDPDTEPHGNSDSGADACANVHSHGSTDAEPHAEPNSSARGLQRCRGLCYWFLLRGFGDA
jgi:hypothetical protein